MKIFLNFLCCFLVFTLPIQNVILKNESTKVIKTLAAVKAPERQLKLHRKDRKLMSSHMIEILLLLILIYMIFNAPVWGIALLTLPILFGAATEVQGRRLVQLQSSGISSKLHSSIKRKLDQKDKQAYQNAKKIFRQYFRKYHPHVKGKLNQRKLVKIGLDVVKKFKAHFGNANYEKPIKFYSKKIFQNKKNISKLINTM